MDKDLTKVKVDDEAIVMWSDGVEIVAVKKVSSRYITVELKNGKEMVFRASDGGRRDMSKFGLPKLYPMTPENLRASVDHKHHIDACNSANTSMEQLANYMTLTGAFPSSVMEKAAEYLLAACNEFEKYIEEDRKRKAGN